MKRPFGVRAAAFLLRVFQAGFGCAAVLKTLEEAYLHSLQLFFAASVWLVSLKRTNTLR